MDEIELAPGQSAVIKIDGSLSYRVINADWVLEISSTQSIMVRPVDDKNIIVGSSGAAMDNEV